MKNTDSPDVVGGPETLQHLDELMRRSLGTLIADISLLSWCGREREIVNLAQFGRAQKHLILG